MNGITEWREAWGVSGAELARESGLDRATVWRAEQGRGSLATMREIASAITVMRPGTRVLIDDMGATTEATKEG